MFVGNLPNDATEDGIKNLFDSSKVKFVKYLDDKRIAFVTFESIEALETAVNGGPYDLNGTTLRHNKAGEKSGK